MKDLTGISNKFKDFVDFVMRHGLTIMLIVIVAWFLHPTIQEVRTLLMLIGLEALAIVLSGFALFAYTKIDYLDFLMRGEDNEFQERERAAVLGLLGYIFLSVHILIGLSVLGVYIVQFAN